MLRTVVVMLCLLCCITASAQTTDTFFVTRKGNNWAMKYVVKPHETLHMLAQRFYLTDRKLEEANEFEQGRHLAAGNVIEVPVLQENYFRYRPSMDNANLQEMYYHVGPKDDIGIISTYAGVTKSEMRKWNWLKGNTLTTDQVLFVGWVKVMARDSLDPTALSAYPRVSQASTDTAKVAPVPGGLDTVFNQQTNDGLNVLTEKGTAVFFDKAGKSGIYMAFHNTSRRGSIIKVYNPGNGKTVYVKVIGQIPNTKQYANAIIGISSEAKEALGVTDRKTWCELSYAAN